VRCCVRSLRPKASADGRCGRPCPLPPGGSQACASVLWMVEVVAAGELHLDGYAHVRDFGEPAQIG